MVRSTSVFKRPNRHETFPTSFHCIAWFSGTCIYALSGDGKTVNNSTSLAFSPPFRISIIIFFRMELSSLSAYTFCCFYKVCHMPFIDSLSPEGIDYYVNVESSTNCFRSTYWCRFRYFHESPMVKMCYHFVRSLEVCMFSSRTLFIFRLAMYGFSSYSVT